MNKIISNAPILKTETKQVHSDNIIQLERRNEHGRRNSDQSASLNQSIRDDLHQQRNLMVFLVVMVAITLTTNYLVISSL